ADAYFASRPRMSQLGAWASRQSQTLGSRAEFEAALAEAEARFRDGPVPRPPGWSGFRVVPRSFEFWYGAGFRLHERWSYERGGGGGGGRRGWAGRGGGGGGGAGRAARGGGGAGRRGRGRGGGGGGGGGGGRGGGGRGGGRGGRGGTAGPPGGVVGGRVRGV